MQFLPFRLLLPILAFWSILASCGKGGASGNAYDHAGRPDTLAVEIPYHPFLLDSGAIATFLDSFPLFGYHRTEIMDFYAKRNHAPAWFNEEGIIEQGDYFMNLLDHFNEEGLRDTLIYYTKVRNIYNTVTGPGYPYHGEDMQTSQLEMFLTTEFFVYAQKVWYGLSEKKTRDLDWYITRKTVPYISILDSLLRGGSNLFTVREPIYRQYKLLRDYLKKYKALGDDDAWYTLYLPPDKKFLQAGDSGFVVKEMKNRLFLLGDLAEQDTTAIYDSLLTCAVIRYELRNGLNGDGHAGQDVIAALNTKPSELIEKISLNMERCRWIPENPKEDYILVNIPEYRMHIYAGDSLAWSMKIVVGKNSTGTAIFNDMLKYIVFSPYWVPPPSIVGNEILPAIKKDPGYLQRENMEVVSYSTKMPIDPAAIDWSKYTGANFPYMIRQKPGKNCALGYVKFLFPNNYNIYFHDTPSKSLFQAENRGFSHGCIRLEQPERLANYLLRNDTSWTAHKIDSVMHAGKETYVKLDKPVPVFIVYFTAWVDENGILNLRKDIYGHDARLEKTLDGENVTVKLPS